MRTYLHWAAFGLRGRFRKNKLFHEQQMTPGFLQTCPSPHSHLPSPSTIIPAPVTPRCHLCWAPAHGKWGSAEAWHLPLAWGSAVGFNQAWNKRLKAPRFISVFSAIWLKYACRFQIVQGRRGERVGHTESTVT